MLTDDKKIMVEAVKKAQKAYDRGECPVGAILVRNGMIVAWAGNRELELNDPTAHAEISVLREAGQALGTHTFPDCIVYTTLWPCPMCCGAQSYGYIYEKIFNPTNLEKIGPIMEVECRDLLYDGPGKPGVNL